jgi:RNA polymerase sigma-70 factor (ECF subfamily)
MAIPVRIINIRFRNRAGGSTSAAGAGEAFGSITASSLPARGEESKRRARFRGAFGDRLARGSRAVDDAPRLAEMTAPHDDERALVAALRAGDGRAYERLVAEHGGRMLAVARRLLRNDEEARDALQEAFLLAFRGVARFEGASRLGTWLHRIVVNAALMKLRSRRAHPEESIEPLLESLPGFREDGHSAVSYTDWPERPDHELQRRQVRELVRRTIDRLPETYRTVLLLRDIEELDTGEVAELLGVTANAVKIRLHRARQALRERLHPAMSTGGSA